MRIFCCTVNETIHDIKTIYLRIILNIFARVDSGDSEINDSKHSKKSKKKTDKTEEKQKRK